MIHTSPGAAQLIARLLGSLGKAEGILGTIAGDDTIFITPTSDTDIEELYLSALELFEQTPDRAAVVETASNENPGQGRDFCYLQPSKAGLMALGHQKVDGRGEEGRAGHRPGEAQQVIGK